MQSVNLSSYVLAGIRYPLIEPEQPIARDQVENFTVKYEGKSPSGVKDKEIKSGDAVEIGLTGLPCLQIFNSSTVSKYIMWSKYM